MAYRVETMVPAYADIEAAYNWIKSQDSIESANHWFNGINSAINSLSEFPALCPLSVEGQELKIEVRQKLYGNRRSAYRILFNIASDAQGSVVRILRVVHGSRKHLRFDELNLN